MLQGSGHKLLAHLRILLLLFLAFIQGENMYQPQFHTSPSTPPAPLEAVRGLFQETNFNLIDLVLPIFVEEEIDEFVPSHPTCRVSCGLPEKKNWPVNRALCAGRHHVGE